MDNHEYSPSEIQMLEIMIRELKEQVLKLEREKFLLTEQVKTLEQMVKK